MWITIGLAAMVLVLAEAMRVELVSSANEYSSLQAQAVEEGAIRYVLSRVESLGGQVPKDEDVPCEAVRVGQGAFWIIRPDPYSTQTQTVAFGLVDEASKVNLNLNANSNNAATLALLANLPGMNTDLAACIADWRDKNSHTGGAKSDYYMMLNPPYQCKQAPFETVEELLLVKDMSRDILFGQDTNRNGVQDPGEAVGYGQFDRGVYPFVTAFSNQTLPTPPSSGTGTPPTPPPPRRLININTAPKEVLTAMGLNDTQIAAVMAQRLQSGGITAGWVAQQRSTAAIWSLITTVTYQFSADIVSVAGDGRAFKRCRIVVDNRKSPARVIYRQELTSLGWPLSPDIISGLRAGKPIDQVIQPVSNMRGLTAH